jgi:dihydropteroate synthase
MPAYRQHTINCKGKLLDLSSPVVMGIINATPDSFYDGGEFNTIESALGQAKKMLNQGASVIDVGGYSSRPGAAELSISEEINRTSPIIQSLANEFPEICISIDTFRSEVAIEAVRCGASIINDISAGDDDDNMLSTVAQLGVPYILMHKQGQSKTMQNNPNYENVVDEVFEYLARKILRCREVGISDLIIDPGLGFGKTVEHNFQLIKHLKKLAILEVPILVGASRKSMIKKVIQNDEGSTLNGTSVINTISLLNGASILRVHDVMEAIECIRLVQKLEGVE